MHLTSTARPRRRDPNAFPTTQLALLALVRLAEPIALCSIFPYAIKLVENFHVGDQDNAAFYAGLLISTFAFAEACSGVFWGTLSDRVGRKPILLFACAGTALSLLMVGFATNYWIALLGRLTGGLLNGSIPILQTMVGELVTRPEHEPRAYSVMPFVWSVGTVIGPAIGGYFANPSHNFPSTFPADGIFGRFPYLLPNVICASLMAAAIVAGYFMIEETHPNFQPAHIEVEAQSFDDLTEETRLIPSTEISNTASPNAGLDAYGTFNTTQTQDEDLDMKFAIEARASEGTTNAVFTKPVIMLILALFIFCFHSMAFDHLLPIFLQDGRSGVERDVSTIMTKDTLSGGLGLSTQDVGVIMGVGGLIALFIQAVVFPALASWLGVSRLLVIVSFGHPLVFILTPFLPLLHSNLLYPGLFFCLTLRNLTSIIAYPLILILLKDASPRASCLGRINGVAASLGAASRTAASPVAGLFYGIGIKIAFTPLAWWFSAGVAIIGAAQILCIDRQSCKATPVHFVDPEKDAAAHIKKTMRVSVTEVHAET